MVDFVQQRRAMVDGQIRANDVTDQRIVAAMLEVPRERFVPAALRELAYIDDDLRLTSVGRSDRFLMEPMVLAKLLQALDLRAEDRVLDIGAATGYSAALLARLVRSVVALEEDKELSGTATALLGELGAGNVKIVTGPLVNGWAEQAPYDAILLDGAAEIIPEVLLHQLREGGRLGSVMRSGAAGRATIHSRVGAALAARPVFDASVPLLPGFAAPRAFAF
jgi:protein-L-isoaspartate(D-aspartate) O-methyltransferase